MSANARVAGRGGRGNQNRNKGRQPQKKGYISSHPDPAVRVHTFDIGKVTDAAQYVKNIEVISNYIGRTDRYHANRLRSILNDDLAALPTIDDPHRPTAEELAADPLLQSEYLDDRKEVKKERKKLEVELGQLYDELWDQCTKELKGTLEGEDGFEAMKAARNPLELRNRIKKVCCGFEAHKMKYYALAQAIKKLVMFYQRPNMTNEEYKQQFDAMWDTVVQFGGSMTNHVDLINAEAIDIAREEGHFNADGDPAPNADDTAAATVIVNDKLKACFMLGGAHNERYRPLKDHLENQYILGNDQYPDDEEALLGLMNNFRIAPGSGGVRREQRLGEDDGLAFVQEGEEVQDDEEVEGTNMAQKNTNNKRKGQKMDYLAPDYPHHDKHCYHCDQKNEDGTENKNGHIARDCKQLTQKEMGQIHAQFGVGLLQQSGTVKRNYLYLDTCTTNNYMCTQSYLTGVHTAGTALRLQTNGGSTSTDKQGYLGSIKMWIGNTGIANVISLKALEEKCRELGGSLEYNSEKAEGAFIANLGDGRVIPFKRCPDTDFPFIDLDEHCDDGAVMLLQSVKGNMEGFTKKEVKRAIHARDTQAMMGYLSEKDLKTEG